MSKKKIK